MGKHLSFLKDHTPISAADEKGSIAPKRNGSLITAVLLLVALLTYACSAHPVKTDLKTFLEDPDSFAGKDVIIMTTIKDLVESNDFKSGPIHYPGVMFFRADDV